MNTTAAEPAVVPAAPPAAPTPAVPATVTPPAAAEPAAPAVTPAAPPSLAAASPAAARLLNDIMGKKTAKAAAAPATPPVTPAAGDAPVAAPEPAKRKPKAHNLTRETLTPDEVANVAAKAAAAAVAAAQPAPAPAPVAPVPVAPPTSDIPEMYRGDAEVFETLEKINPEKYGGGKLVAQLKESAKKIGDYKAAWQSQNPGQKFDPKDHEDEISDMTVEIPQNDIIDARVQRRLDQAMQPIAKEREQQVAKQEAEQIRNAARPIAQKAHFDVAQSVQNEIDPEMAKVVATGNQEKINEYREANPEKVQIMTHVASQYGPLAERVAELMSPGGRNLFNPSDPLDAKIAGELLPKMQEQLVGTQTADGRTYVYAHEYDGLPAAKKKMSAILDKETVIDAIKIHAVGVVKSVMAEQKKQEEAILRKYGIKPDAIPTTHKGTPTPVTTTPNTPANTEVRASGIGAPGGGPAINTGAASGGGAKNVRDMLIGGILGMKG